MSISKLSTWFPWSWSSIFPLKDDGSVENESEAYDHDGGAAVSATSGTEVHLVQIGDREEGKRSWTIRIEQNGREKPPLSFQDHFTPAEYSQYFQFFADHSFNPEKHKLPLRGNDTRIKEAKNGIDGYATQLFNQLELFREDLVGNEEQSIFIVEDATINSDDTESFHNPVWELLEKEELWKQHTSGRIYLTRVLRLDLSPKGRQSKRAEKKSHIRILLVTGRNLKSNRVSAMDWKYEHAQNSPPPHTVQHTLMRVVQHMKTIGHTTQVQLDILRPATFPELKKYLGVELESPESPQTSIQRYDAIHLDMHGIMKSTARLPERRPYLQFTMTSDSTCPPSDILATEVAKVLSQCTNSLIMNACNESSPTGELGIPMTRAFLEAGLSNVSATSYRLQHKAAKIYFSRFYTSLILNGLESFHRAASDGRLALRDNQLRHNDESRDDFFIHWNWSNSLRRARLIPPSISAILHCNMMIDALKWLFSCLSCCWTQHNNRQNAVEEDKYPMYTLHRNFKNPRIHEKCAKPLRIPRVTWYGLEIEYILKTNRKHSIYIHPPKPDLHPILPRIENLVTNMVGVWTETNFVTEVRVLQINKMLNAKSRVRAASSNGIWPFRNRYEDLLEKGHWIWKQENSGHGRKPPEIKKMLIITGFEAIVPIRTEAHQVVLDEIDTVAGELSGPNGEDFYLITVGSITQADFYSLQTEYDLKNLSAKWAEPPAMMLPLTSKNIELATWTKSRKGYL